MGHQILAAMLLPVWLTTACSSGPDGTGGAAGDGAAAAGDTLLAPGDGAIGGDSLGGGDLAVGDGTSGDANNGDANGGDTIAGDAGVGDGSSGDANFGDGNEGDGTGGDANLGDGSAGDMVSGDTSGAAVDHFSYLPPGFPPAAAARVVILGDSISTGTGATAAARAYYALLYDDDGTGAWPQPTTDLLSHFGSGLIFRQAAQNGATTADLAAALCNCPSNVLIDLFQQNETWPPVGHSVVVITIGGNDLGQSLLGGDYTGAPLDTAISNLRQIIGFLQDPLNFPDGTSIFLAAVYDPTDGEDHASACILNLTFSGIAAAIDVWRQRYIDLGIELGFAVVDTVGHFKGHGWNATNLTNPYYDAADPTIWFSDCVHPNDRGHHELRRLFFEAISSTYPVE